MIPDLKEIMLRIHFHTSADQSSVLKFSYWPSELGFEAARSRRHSWRAGKCHGKMHLSDTDEHAGLRFIAPPLSTTGLGGGALLMWPHTSLQPAVRLHCYWEASRPVHGSCSRVRPATLNFSRPWRLYCLLAWLLVIKRLTLFFDVWLLTAFKPHSPSFPVPIPEHTDKKAQVFPPVASAGTLNPLSPYPHVGSSLCPPPPP